MKTAIKVTIGIIAIALGGMSVAQAEQGRHKRGYDNPRHQQVSRDRDHQRKYTRKRHDYRHDRRARHSYDRHRGHRAPVRRHVSRDYRHHGHSHVRHYVRHEHHYRVPRHGVNTVIVERRHHSHLPVVVGGIVGSAIANDVSHGDPGAIIGGAVIGAVVGRALSY